MASAKEMIIGAVGCSFIRAGELFQIEKITKNSTERLDNRFLALLPTGFFVARVQLMLLLARMGSFKALTSPLVVTNLIGLIVIGRSDLT